MQVTVESASIPVIILPADRLLTNWPEASEYTVRVDLNTSAANIGDSFHLHMRFWKASVHKTPDMPLIRLRKDY